MIILQGWGLEARPEFSDELHAVKTVRQNYRPTEEILSLLEDFRCMVNDCIRIGLRENLTSMKSLSMKAYHQLSAYVVPTCYRLTAISRAAVDTIRPVRDRPKVTASVGLAPWSRISLIRLTTNTS